jgi:hypothetical protein
MTLKIPNAPKSDLEGRDGGGSASESDAMPTRNMAHFLMGGYSKGNLDHT